MLFIEGMITMLRQEAVKVAKSKAKRIKDVVYVVLDDNYGYQGFFTVSQYQYDNHSILTEDNIVAGYDQYGRAC